jgi:L-lactate dehydrogenase (cytochrome)
MYSVAALGSRGGNHAIGLLKTQLQQVMEQVCAEKVSDLRSKLA